MEKFGRNFEGPKIVGKIDLSVFDKKSEKKIPFNPEKYLPKLEGLLASQSFEINEEYGDFLDDEAKIKMTGDSVERDEKEIIEIEEYFARGRQQDLATWKNSRKNQPSIVAEMAVTSVLHKFMGKDFIVARATDYDDYKNGVDNVLIHKESGAVICGFDEVLGSVGDSGIKMKEDMITKSKKKADRKQYGASLKYGAKIVNGLLEKSSMSDLPTFFLSLSREELMLLLEDVNKDNQNGGEYEKQMFDKFILLMKEQLNENLQKEGLDLKLKNKLLSSQKIINQLN